MSRSRIVLVEWNDSNMTHGWHLNDAIPSDMAHCRTVGIIQSEDDNKLVLAMGDSSCGLVLEPFTIPKGCIIKIKELRVK